MSRAVHARLSRLEAAAPPAGQVIPVWRKTEAEIEAEQAEMIRRGVASPSDTFQLFTWMEATEMPSAMSTG